jgi:outer membrane lipoprotein SlyB
MASNLSPQVTFDADGVARTETTNRGRTIRTTASATRDAVEISYVGDRANDFYLTLSPTRDDQLRVTRRLYLENRNETVSVSSVYDKIDPVARWTDINMDGLPNTGTTGGMSGDFYIPNGTRLTATLNNMVTTRATQSGDRFTMNVTSPEIYRNAVIEGRVAQIDNSGRVSGRANMSFEFDTIRMRDGRTYRFAGIIDSVRTLNGDTVSVTNEGTIRDRNQTTRTATRAGIGAALGALIGAIAGGGSGAAVGAAVGAGAGAGTVLIQGRDNVELGQGTEFNITATGPTSVGVIR